MAPVHVVMRWKGLRVRLRTEEADHFAEARKGKGRSGYRDAAFPERPPRIV